MKIIQQLRHLARHSAIYAVSTAMQRLPGLLLIPIYTKSEYIATQADFGNYVLVFTFIAFMNFFYLFGLDSAMLRYYFLDNQDRKSVVSVTFWLLLISCTLMSVFIWQMSEPLAVMLMDDPAQASLVRIASLIPLFDAYGNLAYNLLRAEEKAVQFTLFKSLRFTLELGLNILFVVVLRYGVPGIFYTSLGASIINLLVLLPVLARYVRPRFDRRLAGALLAFGLPLLPNGIAFMTIELVDNFLVKSMLSKESVAVYRANYRFGAILLMFVTAFRNAWQPFFLKIADQEDAPSTYARVLTYYVIGGAMVVLFVSYFIRDLLIFPLPGGNAILNDVSYWPGIPVIPLILMSYFLFGIYVIFTPGFYIRKKSQYMILFTGCGALVNILANIWLLPLFNSFWGAAWATVLSYLAMTASIMAVSQRIYPIPLDWQRIIQVFVLLAITLGIYYFYSPGFLLRILVVITALVYTVLGILHGKERQLAVKWLTRQKIFYKKP